MSLFFLSEVQYYICFSLDVFPLFLMSVRFLADAKYNRIFFSCLKWRPANIFFNQIPISHEKNHCVCIKKI